MKIVKHNRFIIELQNFVDHDLCEQIVKKIEANEFYKNNECEKNLIRHNKCINLSEIFTFKEVDNLVHGIISNAHEQYTKKCVFSQFLPYYYHNLSCNYIYRYYDSGDYYSWHIDKENNKEYVYSYVVYLNDDFKGGDTLFLADQLRIKPKKGSVLCFPCDFTYIHKSTKIKSGMKKIIWTCLGKSCYDNENS